MNLETMNSEPTSAVAAAAVASVEAGEVDSQAHSRNKTAKRRTAFVSFAFRLCHAADGCYVGGDAFAGRAFSTLRGRGGVFACDPDRRLLQKLPPPTSPPSLPHPAAPS
jgi:hypothetical protein